MVWSDRSFGDPEPGRLSRKITPLCLVQSKFWGESMLSPFRIWPFAANFSPNALAGLESQWNNFSLEGDLWQVITKSVKHIWKEETHKLYLTIFKCVVQAGITWLNMVEHVCAYFGHFYEILSLSYIRHMLLPHETMFFYPAMLLPFRFKAFSFLRGSVFLSFTIR